MSGYSDALGNLVDQLAKLPGIGRKSAQRLAFHILKQPEKEAQLLAEAILTAKAKIHYCSLCYNLTDKELCSICSNPERDQSVLCVVEDARDVIALERAHQFHGLYHYKPPSRNKRHKQKTQMNNLNLTFTSRN